MTPEEAKTEIVSRMAMVCLELGIPISGLRALELTQGMLDRAMSDMPLLMEAVGAKRGISHVGGHQTPEPRRAQERWVTPWKEITDERL